MLLMMLAAWRRYFGIVVSVLFIADFFYPLSSFKSCESIA
jgi:hypothetical protein